MNQYNSPISNLDVDENRRDKNHYPWIAALVCIIFYSTIFLLVQDFEKEIVRFTQVFGFVAGGLLVIFSLLNSVAFLGAILWSKIGDVRVAFAFNKIVQVVYMGSIVLTIIVFVAGVYYVGKNA